MAQAALFATTAAAQITTPVWVTNAFAFRANHPYDFTICLDGEALMTDGFIETTETGTDWSLDGRAEIGPNLRNTGSDRTDIRERGTLPSANTPYEPDHSPSPLWHDSD